MRAPYTWRTMAGRAIEGNQYPFAKAIFIAPLAIFVAPDGVIHFSGPRHPAG